MKPLEDERKQGRKRNEEDKICRLAEDALEREKKRARCMETEISKLPGRTLCYGLSIPLSHMLKERRLVPRRNAKQR